MHVDPSFFEPSSPQLKKSTIKHAGKKNKSRQNKLTNFSTLDITEQGSGSNANVRSANSAATFPNYGPSGTTALAINKSAALKTQPNPFIQITFAKIDWDNCRTILEPIIDSALNLDSMLPKIIIDIDDASDASKILTWLKEHCDDNNVDTGDTSQQLGDKKAHYKQCFRQCIINIAESWPPEKIRRLADVNQYFKPTIINKGRLIITRIKYGFGFEMVNVPYTYNLHKPDNNPAMHIASAVSQSLSQLLVLAITAKTNDHVRHDQICSQLLTTAIEQQRNITNCLDKDSSFLSCYNAHLELIIKLFTRIIKPEYQVEIIAQYQNDFVKSLILTAEMSLILIRNGALLAAIELIDQALKFYHPSHDILADSDWCLCTADGLGYCLFNKGVAFSKQGKWTRAFECYQAAFAKHPEDFEILSNLMAAAWAINRYDLALRIIAKLPDSPTKTILILSDQVLFTATALKEIAKYTNANVKKPFDQILLSVQLQAQYQKQLVTGGAIELKKFERDISLCIAKGGTLLGLLNVCGVFKQQELAVKIVQTIDQSVVQNNPTLQYYKVLYLSRQGEDLLAEIAGYQIEYPSHRATLYYVAATIRSNPDSPLQDLKLAIKYIEQAVKLDPENECYDGLRLAIQAKLAINNDKILIVQHDDEEQLVAFLAAELEPDEDSLALELEFSAQEGPLPLELKSREEHPLALTLELNQALPSQFEHKGSRVDRNRHLDACLRKRVAVVDAILTQPKATILPQQWQVSGQHFSSVPAGASAQEVKTLYPNDPSKKLYGCIGQGTAELVTHTPTLDKFFRAVGEGIRTKYIAGVKILPGPKHRWGRVEVKISTGERLYTDIMYRNKSGAFLLIFDHFVSHDKATRNITRMTIIDG